MLPQRRPSLVRPTRTELPLLATRPARHCTDQHTKRATQHTTESRWCGGARRLTARHVARPAPDPQASCTRSARRTLHIASRHALAPLRHTRTTETDPHHGHRNVKEHANNAKDAQSPRRLAKTDTTANCRLHEKESGERLGLGRLETTRLLLRLLLGLLVCVRVNRNLCRRCMHRWRMGGGCAAAVILVSSQLLGRKSKE